MKALVNCLRGTWRKCISQFQLPPATPSPGDDPRTLAFFPLDGKFPGAGTLGLSNPRGGDDKRGQKLVLAQSSSAILSILMWDSLFQLMSSFVIALFLLRLHAATTPVYGSSIVMKLLKLIEYCKVICPE